MLLLPKYREPRSFSYPGIIHVPVTGRIDARSGRCPCLSYCVYETCERLALCGLTVRISEIQSEMRRTYQS
jgi:hypothetical protein